MKACVVFGFLALAASASANLFFEFEEDGEEVEIIDLLDRVKLDGYPGEKHNVTTEDGYILGVYRVPYGRLCGKEQQRKGAVLLQHGLLSNSIDYLISGVNDSLGYILADACYDVWLSNSRGNFESKQHVSMPSNVSEFWEFSWHEMGEFDLPAVIDYILAKTGFEAIHYVGHSQGTTQFFVYASMFPEESAKKVKSMHALAPIAFMENMTSPLLQWSADNLGALEIVLGILGWDQFLPKSDDIAQFGGNNCNEEHPDIEHLCENILFIICGYDPDQLNKDLLPIITQHDPAGASTRQLLHYGQEVNSGRFRRYDYGPLKNIGKYGSMEPPDYEIEKIRVPLFLHYSDNDWLASTLDVETFAAQVPTATLLKVAFEEFNHLDYLWALQVRELVYDKVVALLDKY